jgi:hypothetical protein
MTSAALAAICVLVLTVLACGVTSLLVRLRITYVRLARLGRTPWRNPASGVVVSDGLLDEGVLDGQSSALRLLSDWCRSRGKRLSFRQPGQDIPDRAAWVIATPSMSEYERLFSSPNDARAIARDIRHTREQLISQAREHGYVRCGLMTFYDPFSTKDVTDESFSAASLAVEVVNSELRSLAIDDFTSIIDVATLLRGRASEFTHVARSRFALNWLGHGSVTGLVQQWLDSGPQAELLSPEVLFRMAQGIG